MFTDNRILQQASQELNKLIGMKIQKLIHEKYVFTPTCYGAVYFIIDNKNYVLTDYYETKEFLGGNEEISVLRFNEYNDEIKSIIVNGELTTQNIDLKISKITLVNTKAIVTNKKDPQDEDILLDTHGIIFTLEDDYQLAFEKDDFGEQISIYRGYNLEEKFKYIPKNFIQTIDENYNAKCEIEFTDL